MRLASRRNKDVAEISVGGEEVLQSPDWATSADFLPSPRRPFAKQPSSARSSPRSARSLFLHDASSSSSFDPLPSPANSFTPGVTPRKDGEKRRGMWDRGAKHHHSFSTSPEKMPGTGTTTRIASMLIPESSATPQSRNSVFDTSPAEEGTLRRKKSGANLLYQGVTRGLSRVGSVMKRSPHSSTTPPVALAPRNDGTLRSGRRPRHHRESTMQSLCEEEQDEKPPSEVVSILRPAVIPSEVARPSNDDEYDPEVSKPFNTKHNIHVNADMDGLPPEWLEQLKAQGMSEKDLLMLNAAKRRQRAVPLYPISGTPMPSDTSHPPTPLTPGLSTPTLTPATQTPSTAPGTPLAHPPARSSSVFCSTTSDGLSPFSPTSMWSTASYTSTGGAPPPDALVESDLAIPAVPLVSPFCGGYTAPPVTPARVDARQKMSDPPAETGATPKRNRRPSLLRRTPSKSRRNVAFTPDADSKLKRSTSLIGRLLDDLDARSHHTHSSRRASTGPAAEVPPPLPTAGVGKTLQSPEVGKVVHFRSISNELKDFGNMEIAKSEEGWADDIFASWSNDNPFTRGHTAVRLETSPRRTPCPKRTPELHTIPLAASTVSSPLISPLPDLPMPPPIGGNERRRSVSVPRSVNGDTSIDDGSFYSIPSSRGTQRVTDGEPATLIYSPPPPPRPRRPTTSTVATQEVAPAPASHMRESFDSFGVKRGEGGSLYPAVHKQEAVDMPPSSPLPEQLFSEEQGGSRPRALDNILLSRQHAQDPSIQGRESGQALSDTKDMGQSVQHVHETGPRTATEPANQGFEPALHSASTSNSSVNLYTPGSDAPPEPEYPRLPPQPVVASHTGSSSTSHPASAHEVKRFSALPLPPLPLPPADPHPFTTTDRQAVYSPLPSAQEPDEFTDSMLPYYTTCTPYLDHANGLGLSLPSRRDSGRQGGSGSTPRSRHTLSVCSARSGSSAYSGEERSISLSRMSSIASTISSHMHEATVQRAYTRNLGRVAESTEAENNRHMNEDRAEALDFGKVGENGGGLWTLTQRRAGLEKAFGGATVTRRERRV